MQSIARYDFPTTVYSGCGARLRLPQTLRELGVERPLLVCDPGVLALPEVQALQATLQALPRGCASFGGVGQNPTLAHVEAASVAWREGRCDGLVAVGGGAAIDVAKAVALLAHHPGPLFDYEENGSRAGRLEGPLPPLVALPTTAGSGSEVGRSAVIADPTTGVKRVVFSPRLLPAVVLADADLSCSLPPALTAACGMDALTHLVESYLSRGTHPMCDAIALGGLRLVAAALRPAVAHARAGDGPTAAHRQARTAMLDAAMMGAVAFQKGLGVAHACAHALSAVCGMHHGLANGIVLPYAIAFNLPAAEARLGHVADALGAAGPAAVAPWLAALKEDIGIPATLQRAGVAAAALPRLAEVAERDACHLQNPRPVTGTDLQAIFRAAYQP